MFRSISKIRASSSGTPPSSGRFPGSPLSASPTSDRTQSGQIVGHDLNMIPPSDVPFGTTTGDGVTPCDPFNNGDCAYSAEDNARLKIPALGDYVTGFGNVGHSMTTSFQAQAQRQASGFTFSLAYTFLDQKSSGLDVGNSSLGGDAYNPFQPDSDYGPDSFVSRHRIVAYGIFDLPFGTGKRYGSSVSRWADAVIGGWQASTNLFFKTGVGFTPFYDCGDCDPVLPGNVASGTLDAVGDFNATSVRAVMNGNPRSGAPSGFFWNSGAFSLPSMGANLYTQAGIAGRNSIYGPSMYGVNLGVHKSFRVNDRIAIQLGADINNVFNHPMLSPDQGDGGGCEGCFANVGTFNLMVDQTAREPLEPRDISPRSCRSTPPMAISIPPTRTSATSSAATSRKASTATVPSA